MIQAEFIDLKENEKIVMKWRMKDWKQKPGQNPKELDINDSENEFSLVEIIITDQGNDECEVQVKQTDIPEYDTYMKFIHPDNLEGGWKQMIFLRIEQVFGYPIKK